jgi:hypothetical protein
VRVQAGTRPTKPKTIWIRSPEPVAPAPPATMAVRGNRRTAGQSDGTRQDEGGGHVRA